MSQGSSGQLSRRAFLLRLGMLAGSAAAADGLAGAAGWGARAMAQAKGPVNWLSWSAYQLPELMKGFNAKTGITVNPIDFEDDSEGYLKVKNAGGKQYDISMSDGFWPVQYNKVGLIEGLDFNAMASGKVLAPALKNLKIWKLPDGKMMQFPNQWSVEPIVYKKGAVPTFTSWDILWDKKYKGRIIQMDRPSEYIAAVAIYLGFKEPFNLTDAQLAQVKKKLMEQRPLIKTFTASSSDFVKAMASGEGDLGFCPSSGIVYRIKDAGGPDFGFVVPKEGTTGWVDGNMLIKGAAHREAALAWIDYFGSPESQAALAMKTKYPVNSEGAIKLLEQKGQAALIAAVGMKNWDSIGKMTMLDAPSNIEKWTQLWNEYKAG
ncbi:MAG: extracellular solute-binding protein [Candidatus Rokubacteria bacterium]|nr:extracellular solute-binding protein [Candidatus Rokubacteria bacterium]